MEEIVPRCHKDERRVVLLSGLSPLQRLLSKFMSVVDAGWRRNSCSEWHIDHFVSMSDGRQSVSGGAGGALMAG